MLSFLFFFSFFRLAFQYDCNHSSCHECVLDAACRYEADKGCFGQYILTDKFSQLLERLEDCKTETISFKPNPFCPEPSVTLVEDGEYKISPIKSNDVYYSEDNYCYYTFDIEYTKNKKICFNITNYLSDEANALYIEESKHNVYQQVISGNSVICNDDSHFYNFIYIFLSESECKTYGLVCKNIKFNYDYTVMPFEIVVSVKTIEVEEDDEEEKKDSGIGLGGSLGIGGSILAVLMIGGIAYWCCCHKETTIVKVEESVCC